MGRKKKLDLDEWNELNQLVRTFNGAKLSLPHVYRFQSMTQYQPINKTENTNCAAYNW